MIVQGLVAMLQVMRWSSRQTGFELGVHAPPSMRRLRQQVGSNERGAAVPRPDYKRAGGALTRQPMSKIDESVSEACKLG
ncbi:hypothetical protein DF047_07430 [Burkholderia cenocepacia]|nr:hypothetical protein DF047_07430 [Burkholderia cenocepacia]